MDWTVIFGASTKARLAALRHRHCGARAPGAEQNGANESYAARGTPPHAALHRAREPADVDGSSPAPSRGAPKSLWELLVGRRSIYSPGR